MAGLLGDIYSTIDSTKRKLSDFVQNPVESTRQFIFNRNEDAGKQLGLLDQSFRGANGQLTIGPQTPQAQAAHNQLTDGLLSAMMGATVWHGSPHKFNKFDSSKIGTGEGAQAYGHGLYLAENPKVAGQYQKDITALKMPTDSIADAEVAAAKKMLNIFGEKDGLVQVRRMFGDRADDVVAKANAVTGQLYKVDLPDEHIAKMLDWDKPLSQQHPDVQTAFGGKLTPEGLKADPPGSALYNSLIGNWDKQSVASDQLFNAGIPGIRYLDGGSRGTGTGTSNYVVFPGNEDILKILERNGKGLLD